MEHPVQGTVGGAKKDCYHSFLVTVVIISHSEIAHTLVTVPHFPLPLFFFYLPFRSHLSCHSIRRHFLESMLLCGKFFFFNSWGEICNHGLPQGKRYFSNLYFLMRRMDCTFFAGSRQDGMQFSCFVLLSLFFLSYFVQLLQPWLITVAWTVYYLQNLSYEDYVGHIFYFFYYFTLALGV